MKHNRRTFWLFFTIAACIGLVWLGHHAYDRGFTEKWKNYIINELAKNGIDAAIGRLTIDPVNGLTARDVKLYDNTHSGRHFADIDHLALDVDLGKMVSGGNFLRTVDLRKASVNLPVDPDNPDRDVLRLEDFNARLHFQGDHVDITQAEGLLAGVQVDIQGSVDLPADDEREDGEARKMRRAKRVKEIKEWRGALQRLVNILDKFESPHRQKAVVELNIDGSLADFAALRANLDLRANRLRCGTFVAESIEAEAVLNNGSLTLRRLEIKDAHGSLTAQAFWQPNKSPDIEFSLDSSIDLAALGRGLLDDPAIGEIVFYQPPHLRADGKFAINQPWTAEKWPLQAVGRLDCHRFTTRGVIFDGLHADLAVRGSEFHVRNLLLEHHSGSATGKCIRTAEEGVRFHLKWNLELNAALPFVTDEAAREFMEEFAFGPESFVSVEAAGGGPDLNPNTWTGTVAVDLRNFSHREVALRSVSTQITLAAGKQVLRDVVVRRPDGVVKADQITNDPSANTLVIVNLDSTANPFPLLRSLSPATAADLADYSFESPPHILLNADIHRNDPSRSSFRAEVTSNGAGTIRIEGERKPLAKVSGVVSRKEDVITVEMSGRGANGVGYGGVVFNSGADLTFNGRFGVGRQFGKLRDYRLNLSAQRDVDVPLGGKMLPAENLIGAVVCHLGRIELTATGRVVDGSVNASVTWPDVRKDAAYTASIQADHVNYARLARIFDPAKNTTGEISGHLDFSGIGGVTASIKGQGGFKLADSDVFSIPLLGPLSTLVSAILPLEKLLYSKAREATASITANDGTVAIKDFVAQTIAFRLRVQGVVDLVNSRVDLTARMNVRGAPGILLWAVSKLFEYEALGTLADPGWKPKHLGIPFVGDEEPKPNRKP